MQNQQPLGERLWEHLGKAVGQSPVPFQRSPFPQGSPPGHLHVPHTSSQRVEIWRAQPPSLLLHLQLVPSVPVLPLVVTFSLRPLVSLLMPFTPLPIHWELGNPGSNPTSVLGMLGDLE